MPDDIYEILDKAGLNAGNLLHGSKSMQTIVIKIRLNIAMDVTKYIKDNYETKV